MGKYTREDILRLVREEDIQFIRMQFTDIFGQMKNVAITASQIEKALDNQIMMDGSSIEGFVRIEESDQYLWPDLDTFAILPWRPQYGKVARLICDVHNPDGTPFVGDPRGVLKRALARAGEMGLTFNAGPELEFFLFQTDEDGRPTTKTSDEAGYFDLGPLDHGESTRREICLCLEEMGFEIEASHHEVAAGQHEIDFKYTEALQAADNIMTFRTVVKEISLERGIYASFMPKPMADQPGSGMHTHLSLFEGDSNAFYEAGQEFNMSLTARQFAAGILYHAAEICAITDQYVNSYKRLWGGNEAPSYICWGHNNRSALLRIPQYKPGKGNSARMEFRALDPVANPYLAYSVLLAAGLDGIEQQLTLGEPTSDDVWELTDAERRAMGIQPLPESLDEALKIMEKSDFVAGVIGEHAFEYFLRNKRQEWNEYSHQVTPYELKTYLPRL